MSLEDYVVAHPDSEIVNNAGGDPLGGGVAFFVGGAGEGQLDGQYFVDDLSVGAVDAASGDTRSTDTFDLEPIAPAVSIGNDKVRESNKALDPDLPRHAGRPRGPGRLGGLRDGRRSRQGRSRLPGNLRDADDPGRRDRGHDQGQGARRQDP